MPLVVILGHRVLESEPKSLETADVLVMMMMIDLAVFLLSSLCPHVLFFFFVEIFVALF